MGSTPRGISASRGASILGLSQWASPFETWQRIMEERFPANDKCTPKWPGYNAAHGYTLPPDADSAAIRWGLAFEDAICELDEEVLGEKILDREMFFSYPLFDNPVVTCHIDGRLASGVLVENKTTTAMSYREKWGDEGTDRIPQNYQIQCQQQLLCTGAAEVIVSVLVFPEMPEAWEKMGWYVGHDGPKWWLHNDALKIGCVDPMIWARALSQMGYFHQYRVKANLSAQAAMLAAYREWWETYVIGETPPAPRDYADVRRYFPEPVGTIVADPLLESWLREYKEIGEEISASGRLGKRRDELKVLSLLRMRGMDKAMDDESRDKTVVRDNTGKKLIQFDGKVFR